MPKIAAIQMCSSDNVDENLATAKQLIKKAARGGAELIILPEMFAIMGRKATDKIDIKEQYSSGKIQDFLSKLAAELSVWIVGGTIPIACKDERKIRAACIVYNAEGKAVARYDKIHLFDADISAAESYRESDTTEAGNTPIVVDTPVGKLGLCVCYDIRFPELLTSLAAKGAEIIAVPSAFTVATGKMHWQLLTRTRAIDTACYVIGPCQGGTHVGGRKTYGHSIIVDPWGSILQEAKATGNAVIYAEIKLEKVAEFRKAIPVHQHRKIVDAFSWTQEKDTEGNTTAYSKINQKEVGNTRKAPTERQQQKIVGSGLWSKEASATASESTSQQTFPKNTSG